MGEIYFTTYKELKGFRKIALEPGQTQTVTFEITPDMLKSFDDIRTQVEFEVI